MNSGDFDRGKIEDALTEFILLLEQEELIEDDYQKWFEKYDFIFTILGYKRVLVKPVLRISKQEFFVPDFMVQKIDEMWEIIDLKRPDTKTLKDRSRRASFYLDFEEYYTQCRDYSQFFLDLQHRMLFEQEHNTTIQNDIISTLIAGRNDGIDKRKINNIIFDRGSKVNFLTYDDIKNALELFRVAFYQKYEDNPGYSIHLLIIPKKLPNQNNFLFDLGENNNQNRLSLYIDQDDNIVVQILDASGECYSNVSTMNSLGISYDKLVYIIVEMGLADNFSVINVESDSGGYSDRVVNKFSFVPKFNFIVGSDLEKKAETHMELLSNLIFDKTLKFQEKLNYRRYFYDRIHDCLSAEKLPPRMLLKGHQFMCTKPESNTRNLYSEGEHRPIYLS